MAKTNKEQSEYPIYDAGGRVQNIQGYGKGGKVKRGDKMTVSEAVKEKVQKELDPGGSISRRTEGKFKFGNEELKKKAKKSLDTVIRKMNPLDISSETKGRVLSKRQEFLNYLSKENEALALKLESEYNYKVRLFNKIIKSKEYRDKYSIYPYD